MLKFLYIGLIYYLSFLLSKEYVPGFAIYAILISYFGVLIYIGAFNFLDRFAEFHTLHTQKRYAFKHEVYLFLLFAVSLLVIQPIVGSYVSWLNENVDMPTFLFILLLTAIWILKLHFTEIAKISLIILGIIPLMLCFQYDSVAETFAIITYLLWGVLILKILFQQRNPDTI